MTIKELLTKRKLVLCPGAYDALSALMIEKTGYDMVYISGLGLAASYLGMPDIGLPTASEVVERAKAIAQVVNVPVLCDIDTGFGGSSNVWRTIRELEAAGVSGAQLEDQTFPKRCGYLAGKQVIPVEDYLEKLRAALDARKNKDFVIVARTDCKESLGMDEVVRRLNIYADNGADLAYSGSTNTLEEHRRLAREVKIPIMAAARPDPVDWTVKQWENTGVKFVVYWSLMLFASTKAQLKVLKMLQSRESLEQMRGDLVTYEEYANIVGLSQWMKRAGM